MRPMKSSMSLVNSNSHFLEPKMPSVLFSCAAAAFGLQIAFALTVHSLLVFTPVPTSQPWVCHKHRLPHHNLFQSVHPSLVLLVDTQRLPTWLTLIHGALSVDAVVKNATDANAMQAQTEQLLWHQ